MFDQCNHVTADIAAATVPTLFLNVNGKAIIAATSRTRSATINTTTQLNAASQNLILDPDSSRVVGPILKSAHCFALEGAREPIYLIGLSRSRPII
jgi:hypothetical protein